MRPYVFFSFFLLIFLLFYIFHLSIAKQDQDQNWGKDNPYVEGNEAKFQQDLLLLLLLYLVDNAKLRLSQRDESQVRGFEGFGGSGILPQL